MKLKASVIVAIYNNTLFLNAVLNSLKQQSEKGFEIIIAEDGESDDVRKFIQKYPFEQPWIHISQKDAGWRKNHAMNRAIIASNTSWLIFVDGDCVLHPRFVEMHLRYADENTILGGKRVKLDADTSNRLLNTSVDLQKILIKKLLCNKASIKFLEEGIFISPDGVLGFIPKLRKIKVLKGCNMSFSKKAILAINGFDENYVLPAIGEDIDLSWRFIQAGFKHKSVRNLAVQYHLYHKENWVNQDENLSKMLEKQSRKEYICKNGLIKK